MKILLPFLNGSLRAEQAIKKAKERAGKEDEIILLYTFPSGIAKKASFPKQLFIALCGNYILNYAEGRLKTQKTKKIFQCLRKKIKK